MTMLKGLSFQDLFNLSLAFIGVLFGYLVNAMRTTIKDLQDTDKKLADKVQSIEVFIADRYVKRDEVKEYMRALFNKLDKIEEKLDDKVDKEEFRTKM